MEARNSRNSRSFKRSSCSEVTCSSLAPMQCECQLKPKFCSRHFKQHAASCSVHQQASPENPSTEAPPNVPVIYKHQLFSETRPVSELYKRLAGEQVKLDSEPKADSHSEEKEVSSDSDSSDSLQLLEPAVHPKPEAKPSVPVKFATGEELLSLSLETLLRRFRKLDLGCRRYKPSCSIGSCAKKQASDGVSVEILGKLIGLGKVQFDKNDEFHIDLLEWVFSVLRLPTDSTGWRKLQSQPSQLKVLKHGPLALYLFLLVALLLPAKAQALFKHISQIDESFLEALSQATGAFLGSVDPGVPETIGQNDPLVCYGLFFAAVLNAWVSIYLELRPVSFHRVNKRILSKVEKKREDLALFGKQLFFVNQLT